MGDTAAPRAAFVTAIVEMEEDDAERLARELLAAGADPADVLEASKEALAEVGRRYEAKEYFLPELIIAGDMMKSVATLLKPLLAEPEAGPGRGTVVIGTVAGDIHDIGKDIVGFMLDLNGFDVVDLGVDVPAERFVAAVRDAGAPVLALSGFLTLAFDQMKATVEALADAGLRDRVKVMVGGAIMGDEVVEYVGADAYGTDAQAAVRLAEGWLGGEATA